MDRIQKLKALIAAAPGDSFVKHALALEYVKLSMDEPAKLLFTEILDAEPDYVGSYYHLGRLLERNGDVSGAANVYRKGIQVATKLQDSHARNELQMALQDMEDEEF